MNKMASVAAQKQLPVTIGAAILETLSKLAALIPTNSGCIIFGSPKKLQADAASTCLKLAGGCFQVRNETRMFKP